MRQGQRALGDEFRIPRRSEPLMRSSPPMPHVRLRGPLKKLAGDRSEHQLSGSTVLELLVSLEREHPAMAGWVLDERRTIRRHINVFVNGERGRETTRV